MHWTIGFVVTLLVAFAVGAYVCKTWPGSIPVIT